MGNTRRKPEKGKRPLFPVNLDDNWPKYTLVAVASLIAGILATHTMHGTKIAAIEMRIERMGEQQDRIERQIGRILDIKDKR